ncbi:MAG: ABC transporter ATP-binding protein, partial [Chloroflexia bacterium]|nr:ABC transporter ATP-binding protein [Chloroflexia bacterium]
QQQFLEIQARVRKTIIFVTHDIDEAILMGDRIAVLQEGGILAQYDRPEALLTEPNSEFVADFVGADRAIKRLSLTLCADCDLEPAPGDGGQDLPRVAEHETARDALSIMLAAGTERAVVVSAEGEQRGTVSEATIRALFRTGAAEEQRAHGGAA